MITDTITKQIGEAMKARDEVRLSTLRMLSSALNYEKIAKQHDLSQEEEVAVVKREAKKRKDAIEAYEKVGDGDGIKDRIEREKSELEILKEYLPEELGDNELQILVEEAIEETGAESVKDMGKVIGMVMEKAKGRADGGRVAQIAKTKLTSI
jgi:uncharacterized protein